MSSGALFDYGGSLRSIGMVLVAPPHRRRGLARAVMDRCLSMAGRRPTMLIATAMGESLYVDLGFAEVGRVARMACDSAAAGERLPSISTADVHAVLELDRMACGADRSALLRSLLARAAATAVVRRASGAIRAFGIALRQRDQLVVAPLIAPPAGSCLRTHGMTDTVRPRAGWTSWSPRPVLPGTRCAPQVAAGLGPRRPRRGDNGGPHQ